MKQIKMLTQNHKCQAPLNQSTHPPIHPSTYLSFGYTFQGSFQSHQNQITLMVIQTFNSDEDSDEGGVLMLGIFFSSYK